MPHAGGVNADGRELAVLRDRASQAGLSIDIRPGPGGTSFAWRMPLG
jgi:hypothetical protein